MTPEEVSNAQFGQGDVVRAVNFIVEHKLPLTPEGAQECERLIREYGEGFRDGWTHPRWLPTTIAVAQYIVEKVRRGV